jgi:hypothetical protein
LQGLCDGRNRWRIAIGPSYPRTYRQNGRFAGL